MLLSRAYIILNLIKYFKTDTMHDNFFKLIIHKHIPLLQFNNGNINFEIVINSLISSTTHF